MKALPKHIIDQYGSSRAFKATKREQAKEALRAMHELNMGAAFSPASDEISRALALVREIIELQSEKKWGR